MRIRFDGDQAYQLAAINAVVDVFEGQPLAAGLFETRFDSVFDVGGLFTELGIGNHLTLDEASVLSNVRKVQKRNGLSESKTRNGHAVRG